MEPRDCIAKRRNDEAERVVREALWRILAASGPSVAYGKPSSARIYFG